MSNTLKTLPYDALLEQRDNTEKAIFRLQRNLQRYPQNKDHISNVISEALKLLDDTKEEISLREREYMNMPMLVLYKRIGLECFHVVAHDMAFIAPPYHPTVPNTYQCYLRHIES